MEIWRPKPDGPGQVYCGPTELWAPTSPRQCSSGYADPGDSGSLPGVGESFGTEEGVTPGTDLDRGHSGCPVTPGNLRYSGKIHSGQLGALRWSHGFRYPWLV